MDLEPQAAYTCDMGSPTAIWNDSPSHPIDSVLPANSGGCTIGPNVALLCVHRGFLPVPGHPGS